MEYLNYSVAVPSDLEFQLPFLEAYKKSRSDNLQQEEFMIKRALESTKDTRRNYISEAVIPETHPQKTDTNNTKLIMKAYKSYKTNPKILPETVKQLIDRTTECISLKDSIMRDVRKEVEGNLSHHERSLKDSEGLILLFHEIVGKMANSEQYEFDARRVAHAKETISKMLERICSNISQNYAEMDTLLIRMLFNLNYLVSESSREGQSLLPVPAEGEKVWRSLADVETRQPQENKRDESIRLVYEFLKGVVRATDQRRKEVKGCVVGSDVEMIEPMSLTVNALVAYQDNPYDAKVNVVKGKVTHLIDVSIEKINVLKANLNTLKVLNAGIAQGNTLSADQSKLLEQAITDFFTLDTTITTVVFPDITLLYSLLAKSTQFANRKLLSCINTAAASYLEPDNSALYLTLLGCGASDVPKVVDRFLDTFRRYLVDYHTQNVDQYLLPSFGKDRTATNEVEAHKNVVAKNWRLVSKSIDLAADALNLYLEELNNGKNRNGVNYFLFNREYPLMMYNLSPKLSLMEEYKKFSHSAFDPRQWAEDKKKISNITQIVYDLAAVGTDPSLSDTRKFSTLKDYVSVLKAEISQFSYLVHSAEKVSPECQEIVKTYVETLKGLWTQVSHEIDLAEKIMAGILRASIKA